MELVTGDVKPAQEDVDASVEPAGGREGMSKAVDGDVSNPLAWMEASAAFFAIDLTQRFE